MNAAPHEVLGAAMTQAGMTFNELWIAYFSLGGAASPDAVRSYLLGADVSRVDYDLLATAINEEFVEQGDDHPVPYYEDLR